MLNGVAEGHCKGLGSYKRKDMAWLKIIVKDSSEDPRPAYLKRVQKMVDILHSQKKKKNGECSSRPALSNEYLIVFDR